MGWTGLLPRVGCGDWLQGEKLSRRERRTANDVAHAVPSKQGCFDGMLGLALLFSKGCSCGLETMYVPLCSSKAKP